MISVPEGREVRATRRALWWPQERHLDSWARRGVDGHVENERRLLVSVPYSGLDTPSASAEFASPDVTIGFTVLSYRLSGLRYEDVCIMAKNLSKQVSRLYPNF